MHIIHNEEKTEQLTRNANKMKIFWWRFGFCFVRWILMRSISFGHGQICSSSNNGHNHNHVATFFFLCLDKEFLFCWLKFEIISSSTSRNVQCTCISEDNRTFIVSHFSFIIFSGLSSRLSLSLALCLMCRISVHQFFSFHFTFTCQSIFSSCNRLMLLLFNRIVRSSYTLVLSIITYHTWTWSLNSMLSFFRL